MTVVKTKILFIVNPKAGITIKSKLMIRLLAGQYLDSERYLPEIQFTQYAGHATKLASEAIKNGTEVVVAVGGDGTVNEVASALVNSDKMLGILPTGSGNGLAHHLKIPMNLIKALRMINRGHSRMIDTVAVNGRLFTSIAGVGFDAKVAAKFASSGVRGLLSYIRIILQEYKTYQPLDYRLRVDGTEYQHNAVMISFANSDQFGFGSRIAPQAMIDDGLLDICVVRKPGFIKLLITAPRVFFGTFGKTGYCEYYTGREIHLPGTAGILVNLDGEAIHMAEDVHINVNPLSLKVIVK